MGWIVLVRFTLVFLLLFFVLPGLARGRGAHVRSTLALVEGFAAVSFCLQSGILLLGLAHLALSGATTVLYGLILLALVYTRLRGQPAFPAVALLAAHFLEAADPVRLQQWLSRLWRRMARTGAVLPLCAIVISVLVVTGSFPAHHVRLQDVESYSRALSLGMLANGGKWRADPTVLLLLPPMIWSAVSAAAAVAVSRPLMLALFIAAVGFSAFERFTSRLAAVLAAGFAAIGVVWAGAMPEPSAEMSAMFLLFGIGLWPRSRRFAILAALTASTISLSPAMWRYAALGIASIICGGVCSGILAWFVPMLDGRGRPRFPLRIGRNAATVAGAVLVFAVCAGAVRTPADEEAYQYEAAARACTHIAASFPRNTWLIVSPPQELAFTYGAGWHLELQDFARQFSRVQLADPAFHFNYPVGDVFFFVEKRPLWLSTDQERLRPAVAGRTFDPVSPSYDLPLGRATLEFEAAALMAAYAQSHADLQIVYTDERITIYHAPGALTPVHPTY